MARPERLDLDGEALLGIPAGSRHNQYSLAQLGAVTQYLQDKRVIAEAQPPDAALVLNADDPWHRRFADGAAARIVLCSARQRPAGDGAWLQDGVGRVSVEGRSGVAFDTAWLPAAGRVIGSNLVAAAAAAACSPICATNGRPGVARRQRNPMRVTVEQLFAVSDSRGTASTHPT